MKVIVNGDRIQQLRMQCAWTQEQLAEKAGLSVQTVQQLERGENASLESIQVLATLFGVLDPVDYRLRAHLRHFGANLPC